MIRQQGARVMTDNRVKSVRTVHPTKNCAIGNYQWIRPKNPDGSFCDGWCHGKPVFVVAGGPSLIGFDFDRIKEYTTITINRSHRYCRSDVIVFVDAETATDIRNIDGSLDFGPRIVASNYAGVTPGGNITTMRIGRDLNIHDPAQSVLGRASSTLLGVSIALMGGASHVFLLGVDCKFIAGKDHFHPHPYEQCRNDEARYARMVHSFTLFTPERHRIFNLSSESAVTAFRKITIEDADRMIHEA